MEITQEQIQEWKAKYKFIYKSISDGKAYYFHPLSRVDYQTITNKQAVAPTGFDYELEIVKTCILGDDIEAELKAKSGLITVLADNIMTKSGFQQIDVEEV
jgi:hypothetical protein